MGLYPGYPPSWFQLRFCGAKFRVLWLNRQALYEKTCACPACLGWASGASLVFPFCLKGAPRPPTPAEEELHASLLGGAVAMG